MSYQRWKSEEAFKTAKTVINDLFRGLRKRGFIARQSYKCCSSCACATFTPEMTQRGVVFYHQQDKDRFQDFFKLSIRYGAENAQFTETEVGEAIIDECTVLGIPFSWSGSSRETIQLDLTALK